MDSVLMHVICNCLVQCGSCPGNKNLLYYAKFGITNVALWAIFWWFVVGFWIERRSRYVNKPWSCKNGRKKLACVTFLCMIALRNKTVAHTFLPSLTKEMTVSCKKDFEYPEIQLLSMAVTRIEAKRARLDNDSTFMKRQRTCCWSANLSANFFCGLWEE